MQGESIRARAVTHSTVFFLELGAIRRYAASGTVLIKPQLYESKQAMLDAHQQKGGAVTTYNINPKTTSGLHEHHTSNVNPRPHGRASQLVSFPFIVTAFFPEFFWRVVPIVLILIAATLHFINLGFFKRIRAAKKASLP